MQSKKLIFAVAGLALLAGIHSGAFANDKWVGDETYSQQDHFNSTKTRAEVVAELKRAQAEGLATSTTIGEEPSYPQTPATSTGGSGTQARAGLSGSSQLQPTMPGDTYFGD